MIRATPKNIGVSVNCAWQAKTSDSISMEVLCSWNIDADISVSATSNWQVSTKSSWMKWYRVVGIDSPGTVQPQTHVQVIAATSIADVPGILRDGVGSQPATWQVQRVYEYTGTVFTDIPPTSPDKWKEVEWQNVPAWQEFALLTGNFGQPQIGIKATAFSEPVMLYKTEEDGPGPINPKPEFLEASGVVRTFVRNLALFDAFVHVPKVLPPVLPPVQTPCGCNAVPQTLYFQGQFAQLKLLSDFLKRNALKLPNNLSLQYQPSESTWRNQLHFQGQGMATPLENWDILLEWGCVTSTFAPSWLLTMLFRKQALRGQQVVENYQSLVTIPFPQQINCSSSGLVVQAKIDATTLTAVSVQGASISGAMVSDNIGLFSGGYHYFMIEVSDRLPDKNSMSAFSLNSYMPAA